MGYSGIFNQGYIQSYLGSLYGFVSIGHWCVYFVSYLYVYHYSSSSVTLTAMMWSVLRCEQPDLRSTGL